MTIYIFDVFVSQFGTSLCLVLTVASWPANRFLRRQVRWSGIPISLRIFHSLFYHKNFPQFSTVKGFSAVNKAEVDIFLEFSCFFDKQWMLTLWSLVPLPFLNLLWTSGSSRFTYCWSLAWRNLSITLLVCEIRQLYGSLNILWHCLSLGLEWKLTFSSPVATAEFSQFAGILRAVLTQHHPLGFEIAQLEFHHLH